MAATTSQEKAIHMSRKKPRFRGYICDDEVSKQDADLLDTIRQKGRTFNLKGRATVRQRPTSRSPETVQAPDNAAIPPAPKIPSILRKKEAQLPRKKPRFRGYICDDEVGSQDKALADAIRLKGRVFSLEKTAISSPASPVNTTIEHSSRSSIGIEKATKSVKIATQNAKKLQAEAATAAKVAAEAKRRAKDAMNKLEETNRNLRYEKEKQKAQALGVKFYPGWARETVTETEMTEERRRRQRSLGLGRALQLMRQENEESEEGENEEEAEDDLLMQAIFRVARKEGGRKGGDVEEGEEDDLLPRYIAQAGGSDTDDNESYTASIEDEESDIEETDEETE